MRTIRILLAQSFLLLLPFSSALDDFLARSILLPRQGNITFGDGCSNQGMKTCGSVCVSLLDKCCPDQSGGCPILQECTKAKNGTYGCCAIGSRCLDNDGSVLCTDDQQSCGNGHCAPKTDVCCPGKSYSCAAGKTCAKYGCCDADETPCGEACIPKSSTCCGDKKGCTQDTKCMRDEEGKPVCCKAGRAGCGGSCIPEKSTCCGHGLWSCKPGLKCDLSGCKASDGKISVGDFTDIYDDATSKGNSSESGSSGGGSTEPSQTATATTDKGGATASSSSDRPNHASAVDLKTVMSFSCLIVGLAVAGLMM